MEAHLPQTPRRGLAQEEFLPTEATLPSGEIVTMQLAERGTFLGGEVWVREIRKLTGSGHPTSILATDYRSSSAVVGGATFAGWSQENFFRYMRRHYSLVA